MTLFTDITDQMKCRVGRGRVDITPPLGASLAGYFHDRFAKRMRDPLHARALVFEAGGERLAFVTCDLVCISPELGDATKRIIQEKTGIAPGNVLLCATHTHTGPEIRKGNVVPCNDEYAEALPARIADAVAQAASEALECTLHLGRTEVEGYSYNRLFRLKNSMEVFGKRPGDAQVGEHLIVDTAGPIDPEMLTLTARDAEGRVAAMLVNFALHPDVIGGGTADFISADWPGILMGTVEEVYGDGATCLFLQGASGDINHVPHDPLHVPRGGEWKAMQIGRALAGAAMMASERAEPMDDVRLGSSIETLEVPYYTRTPEFLAEVAELEKRGPSGDFERFLIERVSQWPHDGQMCDVPLQTMRIGEAALFGFPAEIFTRIGMEIKHYSPAGEGKTFIVELANSRVTNYVPTTDQAERSAYGAKPILSRWLCADAGRRMSDEVLRRMHEMWG